MQRPLGHNARVAVPVPTGTPRKDYTQMIIIDGYRYKENDARRLGLLNTAEADTSPRPQHKGIPAPSTNEQTAAEQAAAEQAAAEQAAAEQAAAEQAAAEQAAAEQAETETVTAETETVTAVAETPPAKKPAKRKTAATKGGDDGAVTS